MSQSTIASVSNLSSIKSILYKTCLKHQHQVRILLNSANSTLVTLYLFTKSDIKTIVIPQTIFALALTAPKTDSFSSLFSSLPLSIFWLWVTLLVFCIGNQTQLHSIDEDAVNKPWRPIPSGRISRNQAKSLEEFLVPLVLMYSASQGTLYYAAFLYILGYAYNNLGGHQSALWRNTLCAGAYGAFGLGATITMQSQCADAVPTQQQQGLLAMLYPGSLGGEMLWFGVYSAIIFTTIQVSDIPDIEGDRLQNRRTMPIVCGEFVTRWTSAVAVIGWSFFVSLFWDLGMFWLPAYGAVVAGAIVLGGYSKRLDKRVYLVYNIWLATVGLVPFFA